MEAQASYAALPSGADGALPARLAACRIVFNGRFLASPATGVQRVARELILAIDKQLAANPDLQARYSAELYAPRNIDVDLDLGVIAVRKGGWFSGVPWEQLDLPRSRRGGVIVSLCNLGPALTTAAVTMIHDAQVYNAPRSYSRPFRVWYKTIQPVLGARHKRVLTVSSYSRKQIIEAGVAPASKISVIPNGVDHALRVAPAPDVLSRLSLRSQNYVLGLASSQPHKNVRVLLDAFKDDRLSSVKLVLFGGAERAALERLNAGPLPPNVVLTGRVTDGELRSLMEAALCFCFPSTTEGFGLPPLEALLLGCPAICAPCGALPEVCGDAAAYAEPFSATAWTESILKLRDNHAYRFAMATRGKARAALFTWSASAESLLTIIDQIAADDRSSKRIA